MSIFQGAMSANGAMSADDCLVVVKRGHEHSFVLRSAHGATIMSVLEHS